MVRLYEQHDWVIFCILGCVFIFIFSFIFLHRDATIKEFLLLKQDESSNIVLSWLMTSVAFSIMVSVTLSQFLPVIPQFIADLQLGGYTLNKFGLTLISICLFFTTKSILTYFFYTSLGYNKLLVNLYMLANKFYFLGTIILIITSFTFFYFPIDGLKFLYITIISGIFLFILKLFLYWFNKPQIMPNEWYYKILYICTLQIAPLVVLWKFLFN
ncbi:DUF4271 domain-containing protein [Chryseobacterium sp. POL2]|uniref:DUF4271 domain-containing protein n=1 Tax=Chryseobacterium sp. POL2 TaxID=2713414 RepID=UPI001E3F44C0|nr:DUF4271 domain-containing protein [Chryseobacterium sp. POL2]